MSDGQYLSLLMLPAACLVLLSGYPAAFVLGGLSVLFALLGWAISSFEPIVLAGTSLRIFGLMANQTLVAIPLFIFMGLILERAELAKGLLLGMSRLFGNRAGGLSIAVVLCGGLMAASTGVAGASIMTLGTVALPVMLSAGYDRGLACGTIAACGTLGQLVPPSIMLVILADTLSSSHQEAQLALGNFAPDPLSVVDLFAATLLPGLLLIGFYLAWLSLRAWTNPSSQPPLKDLADRRIVLEALPLAALVMIVLGALFSGLAAPSEGAALGAGGAVMLGILYRRLDKSVLLQVGYKTVVTTGMIFMLIIGASMFSLVFRELGGSALVEALLHDMPGGRMGALAIGMLAIFVLGFFLEFIEIVVLIVPLLATPLLLLGTDPIWLAVLIAINLQTSFLTPPLGVALFYMRGVAPMQVKTIEIYRGALPFVALQIILLIVVAAFPGLATVLPAWLGK